MCSVNLGQFASDAEAARAHDRAALLAAGFHAPTNYPLTEAVAAAAAATLHGSQAAAQQAQQAQQQQQQQHLQMLQFQQQMELGCLAEQFLQFPGQLEPLQHRTQQQQPHPAVVLPPPADLGSQLAQLGGRQMLGNWQEQGAAAAGSVDGGFSGALAPGASSVSAADAAAAAAAAAAAVLPWSAACAPVPSSRLRPR